MYTRIFLRENTNQKRDLEAISSCTDMVKSVRCLGCQGDLAREVQWVEFTVGRKPSATAPPFKRARGCVFSFGSSRVRQKTFGSRTNLQSTLNGLQGKCGGIISWRHLFRDAISMGNATLRIVGTVAARVAPFLNTTRCIGKCIRSCRQVWQRFP